MESQTKKNIYVNFSNRYMIGPLQLRVTILSFFWGGGVLRIGNFVKWKEQERISKTATFEVCSIKI